MKNQLTTAPAKGRQLLLRNVQPDVLAAISRQKAQILLNNPFRTQVSDSEAIFKLILRGSKLLDGKE
jgi:hypothetical protein